MRIADPYCHHMFGKSPIARDLVEMLTRDVCSTQIYVCVVDMNLFELVCHSKGTSQRQVARGWSLRPSQRQFMPHLRLMMHVPTAIALTDPLTKYAFTDVLVKHVMAGLWDVRLFMKAAFRLQMRGGISCRAFPLTERDLRDNKHAH